MLTCTYHPDRPGIGVCVRCRAVVCGACATRVGGINHCVACLDELARRPAEPVRASAAGQWLVVLAGVAALAGMLTLARGGLLP